MVGRPLRRTTPHPPQPTPQGDAMTRRPIVPALTASNGHTTAVDHIARPVAGHVYVDGDGWVEVGDLETLDGHVVGEYIEFTPDVPAQFPQYVPPIGWVPVDPNIGTPIYDQLNADCQPGRTPTGRISRKPPRLPWTGGVSYSVFIQGSRDDHSSYFGGRR
jgi:hypothetical protein